MSWSIFSGYSPGLELFDYLHSLAVGGSVVNLGAEVGSGGSGGGEVLGEDWLEEGAEDELGTTAMFVRTDSEIAGREVLTQSVEVRARV